MGWMKSWSLNATLRADAGGGAGERKPRNDLRRPLSWPSRRADLGVAIVRCWREGVKV